MLRRIRKKDVPPYSALAVIYDEVMEHVDYVRWASYVYEIIQRFEIRADWILDISCGTGSCCAKLAELGCHVVGADSSLAMIRQAKEKFAQSSLSAGFYCADMRYQPLRSKPDVIISLYDSMNYLLYEKDWQACLNDVYIAVKSGGLFIFDVSTLQNSLQDFSNYRQKGMAAGGGYVRKSTFERGARMQKNYFEIILKDDPDVAHCETHCQIIRPLDEILSFIQKSQFQLLAGYKGFSFKPFTEKSERVHFVLKKG